MRTYRTVLFGEWTVVMAKSPGAARYATLKSAREAGYQVPFTEKIRVTCADEFNVLDLPVGQCRSWDWAAKELRRVEDERFAPVLARVDALLAKP